MNRTDRSHPRSAKNAPRNSRGASSASRSADLPNLPRRGERPRSSGATWRRSELAFRYRERFRGIKAASLPEILSCLDDSRLAARPESLCPRVASFHLRGCSRDRAWPSPLLLALSSAYLRPPATFLPEEMKIAMGRGSAPRSVSCDTP